MVRSLIASVLAVIAMLGVVGPAAASTSAPDSVADYNAGEVCPFAVRLEDWTNSSTWTVVDRQGQVRTINVGRSRTRITNIAAHRSITVEYASTLVYWEPGDGTFRLISTGRQLFYFLEGDRTPTGEGPGLFLVQGTASEILDDATGIVTHFTYRGSARDMCARLG
jgi:hypothetical protein